MRIFLSPALYSQLAARHFCLAAFFSFSTFLAFQPAVAAESLSTCTPKEIALYLSLARASQEAYDETQVELQQTPSGCVALVHEDREGNLVIAFRGSMLADRTPDSRYSTFGGENIRRTYRDWVATNLKQAAGFLPRQYAEAAALVEKYAQIYPVDKSIIVTGHSKGGGLAVYSFVAACLAEGTTAEQQARMSAVVFNAAVVNEKNWRRLFTQYPSKKTPAVWFSQLPPDAITAISMRDDPASKIRWGRNIPLPKVIVIEPTSDLSALEQHGIEVVIEELLRYDGE